jgi:hypothetical protein
MRTRTVSFLGCFLLAACGSGEGIQVVDHGAGGAGGDEGPAGTGGGGGVKPAGGGSGGGTAGSSGAGGGAAGMGGASGIEADTGAPPDDAGAPPGPDAGAGGATAAQVLFDGKTLTGWDGNPMIWSVKDEAIDGKSTNGGQLINTKDDYDDFRLIVSSRLLSMGNHLGICMFGARSAQWKYGGCMLVIPPQGGSWDYQKGGGLPGAMNVPHPAFPVADWHEAEILAHLKDGTIRMAVDGHEVLRWKDPNPGRLKKGPIGLQIHAGASEVQYKGISVEVAPKDDRLITVKN